MRDVVFDERLVRHHLLVGAFFQSDKDVHRQTEGYRLTGWFEVGECDRFEVRRAEMFRKVEFCPIYPFLSLIIK